MAASLTRTAGETIKVVRDGLNIQGYPDTHPVQLVEKQIARWRDHPREPKLPFLAA